MDVHRRVTQLFGEWSRMEYIIVASSLLLFTLLSFLTGYNLLYAVRTSGVNRKLGTQLPGFIKKLFLATLLSCMIATFASLIILIKSFSSL